MPTNPETSPNGEHDVKHLIERAEKFSLRIPVVGTVRVPPPDQLAFYSALGVLAALNVIDWPVALAVGVGQAVLARHFTDRPREEDEKTEGAAAQSRSTTSTTGNKRPAKAAHA